jgi:hypothetical protein
VTPGGFLSPFTIARKGVWTMLTVALIALVIVLAVVLMGFVSWALTDSGFFGWLYLAHYLGAIAEGAVNLIVALVSNRDWVSNKVALGASVMGHSNFDNWLGSEIDHSIREDVQAASWPTVQADDGAILDTDPAFQANIDQRAKQFNAVAYGETFWQTQHLPGTR